MSWLVTVAAGNRSFQGRTRDVSASGAKILIKERPPLGTEVGLCFRPPGRRPVETRALVWRLDGEGLACMFVGTQGADFLAAVTPRAVSTPAPRYPPEALRSGTSGEVLVEITVGTDGSVTNARVVRATPARVFDREALNAVRRWRFEPLDAPVTTRRTIGFSPGG